MDARPVFIKVDDSRDVSMMLSLARNKLREARDVMSRIQDLSRQESSELEAWKRELQLVKNKIENVDKGMVELQ